MLVLGIQESMSSANENWFYRWPRAAGAHRRRQAVQHRGQRQDSAGAGPASSHWLPPGDDPGRLARGCSRHFLIQSRSELPRSLVLLWLSANFLFYHLGNYALGVHLCPCLGQLADRLPLPKGLADIALQVLLLYWMAGSVQSLWRVWGSKHWALIIRACRRTLRKPSAAAR